MFGYPHTQFQALLGIDSDVLDEDWQLTGIHRTVLKLSSTPLTNAIIEPHAAINAVDAYGRTALSWAAKLNDFESVKTLLEHGADPNVRDLRGQTALYRTALLFEVPEIPEILLQYGADATIVTKWQNTVLHSMLNLARLKDMSKEELPIRLQFLQRCLDSGLPLDTRNRWGYTPLMLAMTENSHIAVAFLLDRGADYTVIDDVGNGILHWAALNTHIPSLNVLATHGLPGIDLSLRDIDGETALECFESGKSGKTAEEIKAFYRMWGSISLTANGNGGAGSVAHLIEV